MIKLSNLVNSPLFTGGRVRRYSGLHLVEPETLSDHTYETVLLCLLMYKDLGSEASGIDKGLLLEKALLHDLDESIMGDIPRTVKYADPLLKPILDKVSGRYINSLTAPFGFSIENEFTSCKDNSYEGYILKVVDLVLVARKAIRELDLKFNKEFYIVVDEVTQYMKELRSKWEIVEASSPIIKYLDNTLSEAINLCEEVMPAHNLHPDYIVKRKGV